MSKLKKLIATRRRFVFQDATHYSILTIVIVFWHTTITALQLHHHDHHDHLLRSIIVTSSISNFSSNEPNETEATINEISTQYPDIITIPLIPYSIHRRRNLQVAQYIEQQNRDAGYPVRRRYRRLDNNGNDDNNNNNHYYAQQVASLFQGYGTHYTDLWCGTPPQRQTVIVDTGSGVTAFPCSQCVDCGVPMYHIDPLYNETISSTFEKLSCSDCLRGACSETVPECSMSQAYQEGSSWIAYEAMDSCYIGGLHNEAVSTTTTTSSTKHDQQVADAINPLNANLFKFDLKFGCQTRLTGLFKTQMADGIMGMDYAQSSFWWQMAQANTIKQRSFSLCYSRQTNVDINGTAAGALSLGGADPRLHTSDMVYSVVKNTTDDESGLFTVTITNVWLRSPGGGISAKSIQPDSKYVKVDLTKTDLVGSRVIVDSGTTDTYFSTKFGTVFSEAWEEMTGSKYTNIAVQATAEELDNTYPTILIQMNGDTIVNKAVQEKSDDPHFTGLANNLDPDNRYDVIIAIPPSHYFELDDDAKKYVSRFYVNDASGGVLGANAMMGHDINFDVERNRIGWAESNCDYETLTKRFINPPDNTSTKDNNINRNKHKSSESEKSSHTAESTNNQEHEQKKEEKENSYEPTKESRDSRVDVRNDNNFDPFDAEFCLNYRCQVVVCILFLIILALIAWKMVQRKSAAGTKYDVLPTSDVEIVSSKDRSNGSSIKFRNGSIRYPNTP